MSTPPKPQIKQKYLLEIEGKRIGLRSLRTIASNILQTDTIIIEHHKEPIAVSVPYEQFLAMQMALIIGLEAMEDVRGIMGVIRKPA